MHAELLPEIRQIHHDRLHRHLLIEVAQRCPARGLIADLDHPFQRPIHFDRSTCPIHCLEGVLEASAIARPLANLDVRQQTEERPTPVSPAPCVRQVKTSVAGERQALRHIANHVAPYLFGGQLPDHGPGKRLDICGTSFLDPPMPILDRRETEMNHFMGEFPVATKVVFRNLLSDHDAAMRSAVTEA